MRKMLRRAGPSPDTDPRAICYDCRCRLDTGHDTDGDGVLVMTVRPCAHCRRIVRIVREPPASSPPAMRRAGD